MLGRINQWEVSLKSKFEFFFILLVLVLFSRCSVPYYGVPGSEWKKLSKEERLLAIQNYYSDRAVLVFSLSYSPGSEMLPFEATIHPMQDFERRDYRDYSYLYMPELSGGAALKGPNMKQREFEKLGVRFWKIRPGKHKLQISPTGNVRVSGECHISFDARPGTIINLGAVRFYCKYIGTYQRYHQYSWDCNRVKSTFVMEAFKKTYPEIFEALKDHIVDECSIHGY